MLRVLFRKMRAEQGEKDLTEVQRLEATLRQSNDASKRHSSANACAARDEAPAI